MTPTCSEPRASHGGVRLFSVFLRCFWSLALAITVFCEAVPVPLVRAPIFYSYLAIRALVFVALGFLTPLAFWRFDSIGRGLLFSVVVAGSVELLQNFSPGHSASYIEFLGKLFLICVGFAMGLGARYDRQVHAAPFHIPLIDTHRSSDD